MDVGVRSKTTTSFALAQYFEPKTSLCADGSFLNFDTQLALVTHYALLKDDTDAANKYAPYAQKLIDLWTSDFKVEASMSGVVAESSAFQLHLFKDIFKAPFHCAENSEFKFIDLFAGVGGFRIALQNVGGKCVFSSEWDTQAQKTYFANYGEVPFGDITKQSTKNFIPDNFDVLCAGFPCQPFSISGKQKGFEDTRGTLFFDICEIISNNRPKVVFLENVKHLIHHDGGRTLKTIISKLEDLGYKVSWKVLNAADFGVPQNRERIIIIGSRDKLFDFGKLLKQPKRPLSEFLDVEGDFEYLAPDEYTLIDNPKTQPESGLIFVGYRNKSIRKAGVRPGTEHLSRVHKQPNRIYSINGIHPTLPSQESSGRFFVLLNNRRVRKLTINECWRIMGFPDDFVKVSAVGQQYRQLGNSVCVRMIEEIANEIKHQLL
ncbi:MAG: DNA cytosine methyltransferase [Pseudoflavonifractor sp.]|nr:DNA cytosine methyltransferase [Pseudoflavonifractor sp.]